jgi:hypothetical protein
VPLLTELEATNNPLRVDAAVALLVAQFNLGVAIEPAVAALQRARDELEPGVGSARATALLAMTHVMAQTGDSMRAALELAEAATQLAAIDGVDLGTTHIVRGRARLGLGDAGGMEELEFGLSHPSSYDPILAIVGGRQWLAGALHHWRGPQAEWKARRELAELAAIKGFSSLISMGSAEEVRVLAELGELRAAIGRADSLNVGEQAQLRWALVQRALALMDFGELDDTTVEQVLAAPPADSGDLRHNLGVALVASGFAIATGRTNKVREILATLGSWEPYLDRDGAVELMPRLVRTARTAGVIDLVRDMPDIPQNGTPLRRVLAAHVGGQLRILCGDRPTATTLLTQALEGWQELAARYEAAYARAELAAVLDESVAATERQRAMAEFSSMGMPPVPWDLMPR